MKKSLLKILMIVSVLSISACNISSSESPKNDDVPSVPDDGGDDPVIPEPEDPEPAKPDPVNPTPTPVDPTPTKPTIRSITISDETEHHVGEVFDAKKIKVNAVFSDGTKGVLTGHTIQPSGKLITDPNGKDISSDDPLTLAGKYSMTLWIKYEKQTFYEPLEIDVKSGFDSEGYILDSIEYVGGISFSLGHVVSNELQKADFLLHWNKGDEIYHYDKTTDNVGFSFSLKKDGDDVNDYINTPLEQNKTYNLITSVCGSSFTTSFTVYGNYYKLNPNDLTFVARDLDSSYAMAKGDVKVLVIPITLHGEYVEDWSATQLSKINNIYFGETEGEVSLKSYYETASFNQMTVSGKITSLYEENDSELTDVNIQADEYNEKLKQVLANAVEYVRTHETEINLDDYDLDDDGCIDNIHFITNFNTKTYQKKTGTNAWGTHLWPNRSSTYNESGTKDNPVAKAYSLNAINMSDDAITIIHEQGHIFGLEDYYDYNYLVDYVGGADMQSASIFDWNSYSKFTVGWISPYVVTGETEITIGAASVNGDCIVIPANPDTFNNSAYDEYFLIELFSPYGNNAIKYPLNGRYGDPSWDYWQSSRNVDLGEYGVRLYHVDSRMQWWDSTNHIYHEATAEDKDRWLFLPMTNDYYGGEAVDPAVEPFADCKLLSIIQASGKNTFGDPNNYSQYLSSIDLFHQGDVFTFAKYKHFLSKCGRTVTTMDNGEYFPYKITFKSMNADRATIKIELA